MVPVDVLEIDGQDVPEGRLALADNPPLTVLGRQSQMNHPNGALEVVEIILCVTDEELDNFVKRYQRYLGCGVINQGVSRILQGVSRILALENARITIVAESALPALLIGEAVPPLPGFAGYTVTVRDKAATEKYLKENGFPVKETAWGDIFVPASAALGTAIIFRQQKSNNTLTQ
jgi:hypothetical protein